MKLHNAVMVILVKKDQTIATFERNISQHCGVQHVARVWPPLCDVLQNVELVRMPRRNIVA